MTNSMFYYHPMHLFTISNLVGHVTWTSCSDLPTWLFFSFVVFCTLLLSQMHILLLLFLETWCVSLRKLKQSPCLALIKIFLMLVSSQNFARMFLLWLCVCVCDCWAHTHANTNGHRDHMHAHTHIHTHKVFNIGGGPFFERQQSVVSHQLKNISLLGHGCSKWKLACKSPCSVVSQWLKSISPLGHGCGKWKLACKSPCSVVSQWLKSISPLGHGCGKWKLACKSPCSVLLQWLQSSSPLVPWMWRVKADLRIITCYWNWCSAFLALKDNQKIIAPLWTSQTFLVMDELVLGF